MTFTITPTPVPTKPRPAVGRTELALAAVSYLVLSVGLLVGLFLVAGFDHVSIPAVLATGAVATLGAVGIALAPRVRSLAPLRLRPPGWRWMLGGLAAGVGVCLVKLLFRGIGYSALRRYGLVVAILGSAALFGLAHGFTVVLVAAFLLGVVNAWMVERSGSIWPGVAAHAVNNTILLSLAAVLLA